MKKETLGKIFLLTTSTALLHGAHEEIVSSLGRPKRLYRLYYPPQSSDSVIDTQRANALTEAIESKDYSTVCTLLPPRIYDERFIDKAIRDSSPEIVRVILDRMSFIQPSGQFLIQAVKRGDPLVLKALIDSGKANIDAKDSTDKGTALHTVFQQYDLCSRYAYSDKTFLTNAERILSLLLKIPDIKINVKNNFNITPLQRAVEAKWPEGLRQLVKHPKIVLTSIPASVFKEAPPEIQNMMKKGIQDALSVPAPQLSEEAEIVAAITEFAFFE